MRVETVAHRDKVCSFIMGQELLHLRESAGATGFTLVKDGPDECRCTSLTLCFYLLSSTRAFVVDNDNITLSGFVKRQTTHKHTHIAVTKVPAVRCYTTYYTSAAGLMAILRPRIAHR